MSSEKKSSWVEDVILIIIIIALLGMCSQGKGVLKGCSHGFKSGCRAIAAGSR